jgi:predicted Zn-dependent protease
MIDKEQLIADYFLNSLSEKDQKSFDLLMTTDAEFKADLDFQRRVKNAIHKKEHQKLKQHFKEWEGNSESKRSSSSKRIWYIAASIILMLTLGFYFMQTKTAESLYADYYQPAKNIVHPIVRSNDVNDRKNKAFIAYKKKDYVTAHQLFEGLYKTTLDSELLFYDAIALLEIDSTAKAIEQLKSHQNFEDAVSAKTNWYLALAYLKSNDIPQSKQLLKEIVQVEGYNYDKAKKILSALD